MTADRFTFRSAGTECVGYRHIPDGAAELPAVILCPGFGGTQDTPALVAAATAFADAGYVSVTFDYRSFGESGGRPRQIPTVPGQLVDIQAVVEHVRHWPEVDPERVVLWGSSLGGGHAVTAAARDPRIAAVIAQVPFNGFPKRAEGRSARDTRRILAAMVKDRLRATFGREPHYLPAVGDVGELAVMASRDAKRTISTMTSKTWQNQPARAGPGADLHRRARQGDDR